MCPRLQTQSNSVGSDGPYTLLSSNVKSTIPLHEIVLGELRKLKEHKDCAYTNLSNYWK